MTARSKICRDFSLGFALLLTGMAFAQAPAQPGASRAVSSTNEDNSSIRPEQPVPTSDSADIVMDPASLLPDLPPLHAGKASLIGGTIEKLDRIRDQMTVSIFGGGHMKIMFDPRTRIYKGSVPATTADLREGERVYLDTILDGSNVFASSIRVKTGATVGESQGEVLRYDPGSGELSLRDGISPHPLRVHLSSSTRLTQGGRVVPASSLTAGCLVAVKFNSAGDDGDVAREIAILALPGAAYTFEGQIVHLDLRTGLMVLNSPDHKTYEVYLDPHAAPDDKLHPGANVKVVTNLQGSRYVARSISVDEGK